MFGLELDAGLVGVIATLIFTVLGAVNIKILTYVRRVFVAIKEVSDLGTAVGEVGKKLDEITKDNIVSESEVLEAKEKILLIKRELDEAVIAIKAITAPIK